MKWRKVMLEQIIKVYGKKCPKTVSSWLLVNSVTKQVIQKFTTNVWLIYPSLYQAWVFSFWVINVMKMQHGQIPLTPKFCADYDISHILYQNPHCSKNIMSKIIITLI